MITKKISEAFRAKLFYKLDDKVISSETGEVVPSSSANPVRDIIVTIASSSSNRAFTQNEKKHVSGYNYKTLNKTKKSTEWWYSAILDTNFLRDVLRDKYGTNAILLTDKHISVAFFGENIQETIYDKKSEIDRQAHIDKIYQGVAYKKVDINTAISLVKENEKVKKMIAFSLVGIFFIGALLTVLPGMIGGEEEIDIAIEPRRSPQNLFTQTAQALQENFIQDDTLNEIIRTSAFIDMFSEVKMRELTFIGALDMSLKSYDHYSLVPQKNSVFRNGFFVTVESPNVPYKYKENTYEIKDPIECLSHLSDAEVLSVDDESTTIRLTTTYSQKKAYRLIKDLYRCPIVFERGLVSYKSAQSMNIDINAKVYDNYTKE